MQLTVEQQQERQKKLNAFSRNWESNTFPFQGTPNEKVAFEFKYKGDAADLACVQGTCGCTNVWIEGDTVKGVLTLGDKSQYVGKAGSNGIAAEHKNVKIYLEDGKPYVVIDDKKLKNDNPEKVILTLNISGTVNINEPEGDEAEKAIEVA